MQNSVLLDNFKRGYNKYEQFVRKFVYSEYYLILVSLVTFLGWVTKCAPFGLSAAILIICLVLLGTDDILPLTINIFGAMLLIYSEDPKDYLYMWPMLIPLAICIVIFIVKNCRHKFTLGKMFFPQIAVSAALLLGGVGVVSLQAYERTILNSILLGLGVLLVYVFYNHFLKRDENRDYGEYFSRVMMYIGIVICLELIVHIIRVGISPSQWGGDDTYWRIGWGSRNSIATVLILTAGLTLHLSTCSRHGWIYLALALLQYFCIIMTLSRGGIIFGGISGVIALIFTVVKAKNKKRQLIYIAVILGVALIMYLAFMDRINGMISSLLSRGMGSSGRTDIYKEAWIFFKAHPFQGQGMGAVGSSPLVKINALGLYWWHSTFFQVIACMGIIGLAAYLYYYGTRLFVLFKNIKNSFNLFVLAVWIGFEGYCLIDTGTFVPPNMMLIIVMTLMLEVNNAKKPSAISELFKTEEYICNADNASEVNG